MGDEIPGKRELIKGRNFNEIILEFGPRVYKTVRGMVRTHETADDIVQETFLRAYKSIDNFRGESDIGSWLTRIALNIVYSKSRRKKLFADTPVESYVDKIRADGKLPEEQAIENERRRMVEEALATLPEKQRAVFVLRMYDDLPYREIAEIMETSESASRANFYQALSKLKDIVREIN